MANPVSWLVVSAVVGALGLAIALVLLFLRRGGARVGVLPIVLACAFAAPLVAAVANRMWVGGVVVHAEPADLVPISLRLHLTSAIAWAFSLLTLVATVLGFVLTLRAGPAEGRPAGPVRATLLLLLALAVAAAPLPLLYWGLRDVDAFTTVFTVPVAAVGKGLAPAARPGAARGLFTFRAVVLVEVAFGLLLPVVAALSAFLSWKRSHTRVVSAMGLALAALLTLASALFLGRLAVGAITVRGSVPRSWASALTRPPQTWVVPNLVAVVGEVAAACEKGQAAACALAGETLLLLDVDAAGVALRRRPVSAEALRPHLREELRKRGHRSVFIRARQDLAYAPVAKAISAGCGAGAEKIGLVSAEPSPARDSQWGTALDCFVPPPESRASSRLVLRVADDGSLAINRWLLPSLEEAEALLRSTFVLRRDKTFLLAASDATSYGRVVDVVSAAWRAGAEPTTRALDPAEPSEGVGSGAPSPRQE